MVTHPDGVERGAAVGDIHGRFLGHGEPNAWGADGVRAAFWAMLREHDGPNPG